MSAAVVVLPSVWAYAASALPGERKGPMRLVEGGRGSLAGAANALHALTLVAERPAVKPAEKGAEEADSYGVPVEYAFYRKYTEGLLRRYLKLSMEAGRTPSLLGQEMFRGKVTSYKVHSFEDVVIFVHDVGQCLAKLDSGQQYLIRRIALQEYTRAETAGLLGVALRTVVRRYADALDRLTGIFLERGLLEPLTECKVTWRSSCQEGAERL